MEVEIPMRIKVVKIIIYPLMIVSLLLTMFCTMVSFFNVSVMNLFNYIEYVSQWPKTFWCIALIGFYIPSFLSVYWSLFPEKPFSEDEVKSNKEKMKEEIEKAKEENEKRKAKFKKRSTKKS